MLFNVGIGPLSEIKNISCSSADNPLTFAGFENCSAKPAPEQAITGNPVQETAFSIIS